MQSKDKTCVIIDGNAIIHRAYHALPPLTTKEGLLVNAVYGFTSTLLKVLQDIAPTYLAVSFDVAGKTFRDDLFVDYKATRVKADQELYDQIPLVYDIVRAFGIPIYTKEGFEADDIIGTIARYVTKTTRDVRVMVVTGDMDILQLVDDRVSVYELRKGLSDIVIFTPEKVKEKYGFGPDMIVEYKSLCGDASDNIPGVKGIGEKTAKELIEKFGGMDGIYSLIENKDPRIMEGCKQSVVEKLIAGEANARMSHKLATIHKNVEGLNITLEDAVVKPPDREALTPFFQRFEFLSLLKRLPSGQKDLDQSTKTVKKKQSAPKLIIVDKSSVDTFLADIKKADRFGAKEIVVGNDVLTAELSGFVFTVEKKQYFFPFGRLEKKHEDAVFEFFTQKGKLLVGHDLKQLIKVLQLRGIEVKNTLFDIMIASYVLNSTSRAHDIRSILLRELGEDIGAVSDQESLFGVDIQASAREQAHGLALQEKYIVEMEKTEEYKLFQTIEMALIPVLAKMEIAGISLDTDELGILSKEVAATIASRTKKIWKLAGEEFNIASSVQLRDILFEKMKLSKEGVKKGKTGFSTAASELEKLRDSHPIISLIEEYREVTKLQNTYIDVLPTLINKKTGRIHTSFNQAVAATGRLSSSDPNLQNIPIRSELGKKIRNTFVAAPDHVFIIADYSQIELRIVASLAEDKRMMEIFERGEDIHRVTAAAIHNVPLEKVDKDMRFSAKEVNFGVLYGMGAFGLSSRTGISVAKAKAFIKKYFEEFAGVKQYVEDTLAFAREQGYVQTLFGRRRYVPELMSANFQMRSAGERMAVNMPIQGTEADIVKLAMIRVNDLFPNAGLLLQVHDELVFEVSKGEEDALVPKIKKEMEQVVTLKVPVVVDVHVSERWEK